MNFGLTETQEMIRGSAREFLLENSSPETIRSIADGDQDAISTLWQAFVDLGWPALIIAEEYGGTGLGFTDLAVLLEEIGSNLAPTPLVESSISSWVIGRYGSKYIKSEFLPKVASGEILITPALVERDASWDPKTTKAAAIKSNSNLIISGEKRFVSFAENATHALTLVRMQHGDLAMVVAPIWKMPEVEQTRLKHASGVPVSSIKFNEFEVSDLNVIAINDQAIQAAYELISAGSVARSAQLVGIGRKVVDTTVEYTTNREQFGRPVASFQAIQHHLAEMAIATKQTRHLTYAAACSFSADGYSPEAAARAKIAASDKIAKVCWTAHQCHGAIGFTWEHDLHLYTRRALAWKTDYGDPVFHQSLLANLMGF